MPAAVIFDLDGTLLDTLADLAAAVNRALARAGLPQHPVAAYKKFVGDGAAMLIRRALPAGREELFPAVLQDFSDDYQTHSMVATVPYPGIVSLLSALRERGINTAVLSNKPQRYMNALMQKYFPAYPFAAICGESPRIPRKPDPAGALNLAARMRLPPDAILYAGDSDIDMRTATAAGMIPCGVLWGFREAAELRAAGARHFAATPEAILAWL